MVHSFGAVAENNRGKTTGFDYLRLGLALAVVFQHCAMESNRDSYRWLFTHTYLWFFILPAFFALSGYLVTGSLLRNSLPQFVMLRVLRLVPALAVEVVLSATLLGIAFTTLPLDQYISSREFEIYFLNIVGIIHFTLPGVFKGGMVNVQLWTIPYELRCYLILIGLAAVMLTLPKLRWLFRYALVALAVALTLWAAYADVPDPAKLHVNGRALEVAFLWACAIYLFRDNIPYNGVLAVLCVALGIIGMQFDNLEYLAMIPIVYGTVYIGLMRLPGIPFGDLSYGLYLFHYPILQMFHVEAGIDNTVLLTVMTVISAGVFALLSWNFVESPILRRKKKILESLAIFEEHAFAMVQRPARA